MPDFNYDNYTVMPDVPYDNEAIYDFAMLENAKTPITELENEQLPLTKEVFEPWCIKDQGLLPYCGPFTLASLGEATNLNETGVRTELNPYYLAALKNTRVYPSLDGFGGDEVCNLFIKYGCAPKAIYDQVGSILDLQGTIKEDVVNMAKSYRGKAYVKQTLSYGEAPPAPGSIEKVKSFMDKTNTPVMFCMTLYKGLFDELTANNYVLPYRTSNMEYWGKHFVLCIGWKIIKGVPVWILLNSWGDTFGDNGLFYVPMDINIYIRSYLISDYIPPQFRCNAYYDTKNKQIVAQCLDPKMLHKIVLPDKAVKERTSQVVFSVKKKGDYSVTFIAITGEQKEIVVKVPGR